MSGIVDKLREGTKHISFPWSSGLNQAYPKSKTTAGLRSFQISNELLAAVLGNLFAGYLYGR